MTATTELEALEARCEAATRCPVTVRWHDLDIDVRCVRNVGHGGDHRDGVRWWDHAGFQIPRETSP